MKNRSWKTVVAFLCIWALAAGFMTAAAVADENEYIFVNGEKRVFTAEGEVSAVLKLPVEEAGRSQRGKCCSCRLQRGYL